MNEEHNDERRFQKRRSNRSAENVLVWSFVVKTEFNGESNIQELHEIY